MKLKNNLTLEVYRKIKDLLLSGELEPGQRLIFDELAKKLDVSRSPINNALILLMKEGYIESVPNRGYSVSVITEKEAEQLWQTRELIELSTIPIAIRNSSPEKLEKLKSLKEAYEKRMIDNSYKPDKVAWNIDKDFHTAIIAMSDNEILTNIFSDTCERSYLRQKSPIKDFRRNRGREVILEHEQIYESIVLRDIEHCKELIKDHLKAGKQFIFEAVFPH